MQELKEYLISFAKYQCWLDTHNEEDHADDDAADTFWVGYRAGQIEFARTCLDKFYTIEVENSH